MKTSLKFIGFILVVILVLLFVSLFLISPVSSADNTKHDFVISDGETAGAIAQNLADEGLIRSVTAFKLSAKILRLDHNFKSGTYSVTKSWNTPEIVFRLTLGGLARIQLLEGWNIKEMANFWQLKGFGEAETFKKATQSDEWDKQYDFLTDKPKNVDLEGYLFPDTYEINPTNGEKGLIKKMLDNFDQKFTLEMRAELKKRGMSIFDAVTLASIVEKEAGSDCLQGGTNTAMIADIFLRRLEIGLALQSDATVNFITGKSKSQPSVNDTKINNPYNTYQNRGLTPGPISNPGLCALKAVVYPKANNYLYFLTSLDGKNFYYATNYVGHLVNKRKYLD